MGSWRSTGGGFSEFTPNGKVRITGVSCQDLLLTTGGTAAVTGEWKIARTRPGGEWWISLTFPAGTCRNKGKSESGFYLKRSSGKLVLHLRDPGMDDNRVNFTKAPASRRT